MSADILDEVSDLLVELRDAYREVYESDGPARFHRLLNVESRLRNVAPRFESWRAKPALYQRVGEETQQ